MTTKKTTSGGDSTALGYVGYGMLVFVVGFFCLARWPGAMRGGEWNQADFKDVVQQFVPGVDAGKMASTLQELMDIYGPDEIHMTMLHVAGSALWAVLPLFQFASSLRQRYSSAHRTVGKLWMVTNLVQCTSGLIMVAHTNVPGFMWTLQVGLTGVAGIAFSLLAWYHAYNKNYSSHREWVWRAWAMAGSQLLYRFVLSTFPIFVVLWHAESIFYDVLKTADYINAVEFISIAIAVSTAEIAIRNGALPAKKLA